MKYKPHNYQAHAAEHIVKTPGAGLFLEMGLGKTVTTLTAINTLMYEESEVSKVLIIAPKRVAEDTWTTESQKWDHLNHLKISLVLGTQKQRKAALEAKADIYITNRENTSWIVDFYKTRWPFDMLVVDELSSFKSHKAQRFKDLKTILPKIKRVVGLTGTPAPNSLLDLWPQVYLLDRGERLGTTFTGYRTRYFRVKNPHAMFAKYDIIREEDETIGEGYYEKKIYEKISDICISMKAEDYLELPGRIYNDIALTFSPAVRDLYEEFERSEVLKLTEQEEITAVNAAALTTKLLQFANGAIYDTERNWHELHREKLAALDEIVDNANGKPVLVFYSYKHDADRIKQYLKSYKPQELKGPADIENWNKGKTELLIAHPASAGHGLNLQAGGNIIVWFGLPWSLEQYQQANARLDRQGQKEVVIIHRLIAKDTMDEDVLKALDNKATTQDALMGAVKAKIQKYLREIKNTA